MNKRRYFLDLGLGFAQFSAMVNHKDSNRYYEMIRDIALLLGLEFPDYDTLSNHLWWDFKPPKEWFEERGGESLRDFYQIGKLLYLRFLLALPPHPNTRTEQIDQTVQQLESLFSIEDIPQEFLKDYLLGLETGEDPNKMLQGIVQTLRKSLTERGTESNERALKFLKDYLLGLETEEDLNKMLQGIVQTLRKSLTERGTESNERALRRREPGVPLKIFITYAREDREAKSNLITFLTVMIREGLIEIWHDTEVLGGERWREEIFLNLSQSDLLLFLVSPQSLDSDYCYKELETAIDEDIRVIPIILTNCDWRNDDKLGPLNAFPDGGKPIKQWTPEEVGWQNVVDGIRRVVEAFNLNMSSE